MELEMLHRSSAERLFLSSSRRTLTVHSADSPLAILWRAFSVMSSSCLLRAFPTSMASLNVLLSGKRRRNGK